MPNAAIAQQQKLVTGARVELFIIDLEPIGVDAVFHFCSYPDVSFAGQPYDHVSVQMTDVERTTGENPMPKLSLPNTTKFASALVAQHQDLVGAEVTRIKTYESFLDGRPGADPEAIQAMDIFVIEQKLSINKIFAQWELRVLADTGDRVLPGRVAMKDVCPFAYPYWDAALGQKVIPKRLPCPYRGYEDGHMFKQDNTPTSNPALDACDHSVDGGCKVRKPGWPNGVLGFGGFPGMSKYRLS